MGKSRKAEAAKERNRVGILLDGMESGELLEDEKETGDVAVNEWIGSSCLGEREGVERRRCCWDTFL